MYVIYVKAAPHRKAIRSHIVGSPKLARHLVNRYLKLHLVAYLKWFPYDYLLADQCPN